jgi:hypothetical protein
MHHNDQRLVEPVVHTTSTFSEAWNMEAASIHLAESAISH